MLVVSEDAAALEPTRADLAARFPELRAEALDPATLHAAEPALAEGLAAFRLDTGLPVPPAAATQAFAARARAAGAELIEGVAATPVVEGGRATGVRTAAGTEPAGAVVVAAGPWTSALVDPTGAWRPIAPLWGVNVELRLGAAAPPRGRGGRDPGPAARRRRARRPVQPRDARRRLRARLDVPARAARAGGGRARARGARGALRARAGRHPRRLRAGLRAADERRRPAAARAAGRAACSWPRATGRGASRSVRARPGSSPTRSSGGPR